MFAPKLLNLLKKANYGLEEKIVKDMLVVNGEKQQLLIHILLSQLDMVICGFTNF